MGDLSQTEPFRQLYPAFSEILFDALWVSDILSGKELWHASRENAVKYNMLEGEAIRENWEHNIVEHDRERIATELGEVLANSSVSIFEREYLFKARDRSYLIFDRVKIERDHTGKAIRCLGAWRDITNTMRRIGEHADAAYAGKKNEDFDSLLIEKEERCLQLSQELQRVADTLARTEFMLNKSQEITRTGSWEIDLKTGAFICSREFFALHGIAKSFDFSNPGIFLNVLYGKLGGEQVHQALQRIKEEGAPMDITFLYATAGGDQRWFRWIAYPFYHRETMTSITGVVHDITVFKKTEHELRASEEKFFTLFKCTPDFMSLARESDGVIVDVNDKVLSMTGFTEAEMVGKTARQLDLWMNPLQLQAFLAEYTLNRTASAEATWKKKNGEIFYVTLSSVGVILMGEHFRLSLVKDITAKKKAEEKFNVAFSLNPDLMILSREADSIITDINENVIEFLGFSKEEVIGKTSLELNLWSNPEDRQQFLSQYYAQGKVSNETQMRKKNGQAIQVLISSVRIALSNEFFILTSIKDITARIQAEKIFQTVFRSSRDMIAIIRKRDSMIIDVNDRVREAIGYDKEELVGKCIEELALWFNSHEQRQQDSLAANSPSMYEARLRSKGGEEVFVLVSNTEIDIIGEPHLIYFTRNITDRKRAENKIRYSEACLTATINNVDSVIYSVDRDLVMIAQNEASRVYTQKHFGKVVDVGQPLSLFDDTVEPNVRNYWTEKYQRVFKGEHIRWMYEAFGRDIETSINPIRDNGEIVGLTVFSIDVTERLAREKQVVKNLEQLAEAEKRIGELKLMSLRSAMNPHFIFNALNAIQFFISNNERAQAIQFLSKFSRLVRGILTASAENRITLSEELDLLNHYIDLELLRFENKFAVQLRVDDNVDLQAQVPSLLIQPFVENAILHGLANVQGGLLTIQIRKYDALRLEFEIEDNGIGRQASHKLQTHKNDHHKSLGLSLVEERLKILNGNADLSLAIEDLHSGNTPTGTRVKIWIQIPEQGSE
jgi:PAS domain S-box-containing protein